MTLAVCFKCGHLKFGSFCPCDECAERPRTEHELIISMAMSDHFLDRSTLEQIGQSSVGPVNGQGPDTLRAVKDFQTQRQLKVDGKIGPNTFSHIVTEFRRNCLESAASSPVQLVASPEAAKPRQTSL